MNEEKVGVTFEDEQECPSLEFYASPTSNRSISDLMELVNKKQQNLSEFGDSHFETHNETSYQTLFLYFEAFELIRSGNPPLEDIDDDRSTRYVHADRILEEIESSGIQKDDPRISKTTSKLLALNGEDKKIDFKTFKEMILGDLIILERIISNDLVCPRWEEFCNDISKIFEEVKGENAGKVADYIPQLKKVDPTQFAVSVCTVDGQRFSIGDSDEYMSVQSCSKAVNYCLAMEEHGMDMVHRHIGIEPSGTVFNKLHLNSKGLPHNPMLNSGGIMSCSLIQSSKPLSERYEFVNKQWSRLCGGGRVEFDNAVYLSEKDTADRNFCLAYMLQESMAFPKSTDLMQTLDFYFQCCSMQVNCKNMSILAGTFANNGICPINGDQVLKESSVKSCLSLMYSCGMYDFSGEWAFKIGIPAKSGVSGLIFAVVPGFGGFAVWSPRLDETHNSARGISFFTKLIEKFNFHHFDSMHSAPGRDFVKKDPRQSKDASLHSELVNVLYACAEGDLRHIKCQVARGFDINLADYDGRTPIHLAAAEGQSHIVNYLIRIGAYISPHDRWGNTPMSDAKRGNHDSVVKLLNKALLNL